MGAGAKQGQAVSGVGQFDIAARQSGGMGEFGGNGAFARSRRTHQQDAAGLFQIDRNQADAGCQNAGQRVFHTPVRPVDRVADQGFDQMVRQAVRLERGGQAAAQIARFPREIQKGRTGFESNDLHGYTCPKVRSRTDA